MIALNDVGQQTQLLMLLKTAAELEWQRIKLPGSKEPDVVIVRVVDVATIRESAKQLWKVLDPAGEGG